MRTHSIYFQTSLNALKTPRKHPRFFKVRSIVFTLQLVFSLLLLSSNILLAQRIDKEKELPDAPSFLALTVAHTPQSAQNSSAQSSSTQSKTTLQKPEDEKAAQRQKAQQELQEQEHQRILGIMPTFNMTNKKDAAPLTPGQKFQLFFRGTTDPWVFFLSGIDAGISQAEGDYKGYGEGASGYGKRFAASYADTFDGNLWGNAILPSLLHEDPRYFRKGTGSFKSRAFYAARAAVWCHRDDGTTGPNYANVLGNVIGGAISNLYYPEADRGLGLTFGRAFTVTYQGAIGAELIEFWPDIARHYKRKHDEKMARKAAEKTNDNMQP